MGPIRLLFSFFLIHFVSSQIDINHCKEDLACFVSEKCRFSTGKPTKLVQLDPPEAGLSDLAACGAAIAFKQFNENKWLVMMQLTNPATGVNDLSAYKSSALLFKCHSNGQKTDVQFGSLTGEVWATLNQPEFMFCKFTVDLATNIFTIGNQFELVSSNSPSIRTWIAANVIAQNIKITGSCDPSALVFDPTPVSKDESSVRPLVELNSVKCQQDGAKLMYSVGGKVVDAALTQIECDKTSNPMKYKFTPHIDPSLLPTVKVMCSVKTCSQCQAVTTKSRETPPHFTPPPTSGACASLMCPKNFISAGSANATIAVPECKEFAGDFRWTIKSGGVDQLFSEAFCVNTVKCNDVTPLRVVCDASTCSMIKPWSRRVTCTSPHILHTRASGASWAPIERIECDETTGVWSKIPRTAPLNNEEVRCMTKEEAAEAEKEGKSNENGETTTNGSQLQTGGAPILPIVLGAGAVLLLFLVIISFFLVRRCMRKKTVTKEKAEDVTECDAKMPTPPKDPSAGNSAGVSFSGVRQPATDPSLKLMTPQVESDPKKMNLARINNMNPSSPNPTPTPTPKPGPGWATDQGAQPPSSGPSKKEKLEEMLEQSVPSMTE